MILIAKTQMNPKGLSEAKCPCFDHCAWCSL